MYRSAIDKLNNSEAIDKLLNEQVVNLDLFYDLNIVKPNKIKLNGEDFEIDLSLIAQVPVRSVIKKVEEDTFYFEHFMIDKRKAEIFVYEDETHEATVESLSNIFYNIENSNSFNLNCVSQLFLHDIDLKFQKQVIVNQERQIIEKDKILNDFLIQFNNTVERFVALKHPEGCTKEEYSKAIDDLIKASTEINTANLSFFSDKLKMDIKEVDKVLFRDRSFLEPENIQEHIDHCKEILYTFSEHKNDIYKLSRTIDKNQFKALVALSIFDKKKIQCRVVEQFDNLFDQQKDIFLDKNGQASFKNRTSNLKPDEAKSIFSLRVKPDVGKIYLDTQEAAESFLKKLDGDLVPNKDFIENILEKAKEFKQENKTNDPAEFITFIKNSYVGNQDVSKILFNYNVEEKVADIYKKSRTLENSF